MRKTDLIEKNKRVKWRWEETDLKDKKNERKLMDVTESKNEELFKI